VRHRQLVTETVTLSLQSYYIIFFHCVSGIRMAMGNSDIFTQDFSSVRLPIQDMTYPASYSRWTLVDLLTLPVSGFLNSNL
jgi:hypothetical protein